MKIYLAARYGRRIEMLGIAQCLTRAGHQVTSRWIDGCHEAADGDTDRWQEFAQDDLDDILRADTVVSFTERQAFPHGSRHVEFGMAYAWCKMVIIGPLENPFHALPGVLRFDTLAEFLDALPANTMEMPA